MMNKPQYDELLYGLVKCTNEIKTLQSLVSNLVEKVSLLETKTLVISDVDNDISDIKITIKNLIDEKEM